MSDPVRLQIRSGVATITLDRQGRPNVLSLEALERLDDLFQQTVADATVRVIVLTNAGEVFCAGADLNADPVTLQGALTTVLADITSAPVPVIARVDGHCRGGGTGLVAACDIAVATTEATFGFPEVRVGLVPALVGAVVLPRLRPGDAAELLMTGETFSAERAVAVGLIQRAVAGDELDQNVRDLCSSLMAGAPGALGACKRLLTALPALDREAALAWAAQLSAEVARSAEAAAGRAAFHARQRAPWVPSEEAPPPRPVEPD